jgi:hypothetical protein
MHTPICSGGLRPTRLALPSSPLVQQRIVRKVATVRRDRRLSVCRIANVAEAAAPSGPRLIQDKRTAKLFYRFLSIVYDKIGNSYDLNQVILLHRLTMGIDGSGLLVKLKVCFGVIFGLSVLRLQEDVASCESRG